MQEKISILFVCTGNICRSPLAHKLFEKIAQENNKQNNFIVDSCGTGAWHIGQNADTRMRAIASEYGWQLHKKSRQIELADIEQFDYIYVMDASHITEIQRMLPSTKQSLLTKIHYLREYDTQATEQNLSVPDPYYDGDQAFYDVYAIIERSCKHLFNLLA